MLVNLSGVLHNPPTLFECCSSLLPIFCIVRYVQVSQQYQQSRKNVLNGLSNYLFHLSVMIRCNAVKINAVHGITAKENKMSVTCLTLSTFCVMYSVGFHYWVGGLNNAVTINRLSLPAVKLYLILSIISTLWSPVCCQQVHILSLNWHTTFPMWQLYLGFISSSKTLQYNLFFKVTPTF